MSITEGKINQPTEADKTRRTIFIVAGVIAVLLIGLIVFMLVRRGPAPQQELGGLRDEKLEESFQGVLRASSADFEKFRDQIVLTQPEDYLVAKSLSGGMEVTMAATVGNFTGRTIAGLEMKGSVLDAEGKVIKERTAIVVPSQSVPELENNQTVRVPLKVAGFTNEQDRNNIDAGLAKLKVEVTAIKLK